MIRPIRGMRTLLSLPLLMLLHGTAASALTFSITASATGVGVGAMIDVTVSASGLGAFAAPSLGSFDVDVGYDPAVFAFDPGSIAFGSGLGAVQCASPAPGCEVLVGSSTAPGVVDVGASSLILGSLDATQPASFTLATFRLVAIAEGSSLLTFDQLVAADTTLPIPSPFASISTSTVTLQATPEPSWWMLLVPAGWLAALRRVRGDEAA